MGQQKHANRAAATLANAVATGDLTATLFTGSGALFPALTTGQTFQAVIQKGDLDTDVREYVLVTARASDVVTITRAQEGTTAAAFAAGDLFSMVATAATLDKMMQRDGDQATGPIDWAVEYVMASAATVNIGTAALSNQIEVTGSTTITSFGNGSAGAKRRIRFSDPTPPLITAGVSITLPAGASFRPYQNDEIEFTCGTGNVWRLSNYSASRGITPFIAGKAFGENLCINPSMAYSIRSGGIAQTANGAWPAEQWGFGSTNGKISAQAIASPYIPGSRGYIKLTVNATQAAAAGDYCHIRTALEGYDVAKLGWGTSGALPLLFSFDILASITGTYSVFVRNNAANLTYIAPFTVNSALTYERKYILIPGCTTGTWEKGNLKGLDMGISLSAGSTYAKAGGSWGAGNYVGMTGQRDFGALGTGEYVVVGRAKIEGGSDPSAYLEPDINTDFLRISRYYQTTHSWRPSGLIWIGGSALLTYVWPVTMRTTPSIVSAPSALNLWGVGYASEQNGAIGGMSWVATADNVYMNGIAGGSFNGASAFYAIQSTDIVNINASAEM